MTQVWQASQKVVLTGIWSRAGSRGGVGGPLDVTESLWGMLWRWKGNFICDLQAFRIELELKIEFTKCRELHNKLVFTGIRLHWSAQAHACRGDQSRVLY